MTPQEKVVDLQRALSGAMTEKDNMRRMLDHTRRMLDKAMADVLRFRERDRSFERDVQREFGRLGVWCDDVTDPVMLRGCVDLQLRHLEAVGDRLQRFERVWWRRAWRWAKVWAATVEHAAISATTETDEHGVQRINERRALVLVVGIALAIGIPLGLGAILGPWWRW